LTLILNGTDNSATTPAVTGTDTDTGVYYPAANQVAIATSGTQAMLANASQGVQFANAIGVGATTPTTSGAGITFPATQSASSNANTLDDYEEGTFSPSMIGSVTAGSFTYATREGVYTKVGNLVTFQLAIYVTATSVSPSGTARVSGLPFTSGPGMTFNAFNLGWTGNIAFSGFLTAYGDASTNFFQLRQNTTGSFGNITSGADLSSSFYIFASGSYQV